jgi:hypothetical protein
VGTEFRLQVRLTRKLAEESLNGVDVSQLRVGDIMALSPASARLLILEGWAELVDPTPVEVPGATVSEPPRKEQPPEDESEPY